MRKVLLIDDEKTLLKMAKMFFSRHFPELEIETVIVKDTSKPIEALSQKFDLIVVDFDYPNGSVYEVAKKIKGNGSINSRTALVLHSSRVVQLSDDEKSRLAQAGIHVFFQKDGTDSYREIAEIALN